MKKLDVRMGEAKVADKDSVLSSEGVGSCVVVCLHDEENEACGMAHIVLPPKDGRESSKHADVLINKLYEDMKQKGANGGIKAKIFGGASLFDFSGDIGSKNVEAVRELLEEKGIDIVAEDTGGDKGRSVNFFCDSGRVEVSQPFDETNIY